MLYAIAILGFPLGLNFLSLLLSRVAIRIRKCHPSLHPRQGESLMGEIALFL